LPDSAAIVVLRNGRPVAQDGFGQGSATRAVRIASLSKAITALCVSRIIDDGKLRYDSTIGELLPDFLARAGAADGRLRGITVGQMLGHRSGIPRAAPVVGLEGEISPGMRSALEEQVKRAFALPLDFPPGTRFSYSNQAFMTLSLIVEQVTGESYQTACAKRVFKPVGVDGPFIGDSLPEQARAGAGGWTVSALDYARFAEQLRRDSGYFGPATNAWLDRQMQYDRKYGLGYFARDASPDTLIDHNGLLNDADARVSAQFMSYPGGWTVVINTQPARPQAIAGLKQQIDSLFGYPPPGGLGREITGE
jgi:CubicO group peptidase (beta-lactamase class C family)